MRPLLLSLVALTACTEMVPRDYAEVLPDERVLVSLPTDVGDAARDGEFSEFYLLTAKVTDDVNGLIGGVLLTVNAVTQLPPSWSDTEENTAVWGPFANALDPVETVLWVHHDPETDVYTWVVAQRPKNEPSDEAWVHVIAGEVDPDATPEDSSGWFAIDFDAANALDPNQEATGKFLTEYDIDPDGVSALAGFEDFTEGGEAVNAYYAYDQTHGGEGLMDLALDADVNGIGEEEVLVVRSRWTPVGEGRSDAYVTGGDLGALVATASECWDDSFAPVFHTDNYSGEDPTGDESLCAFDEASFDEENAPE